MYLTPIHPPLLCLRLFLSDRVFTSLALALASAHFLQIQGATRSGGGGAAAHPSCRRPCASSILRVPAPLAPSLLFTFVPRPCHRACLALLHTCPTLPLLAPTFRMTLALPSCSFSPLARLPRHRACHRPHRLLLSTCPSLAPPHLLTLALQSFLSLPLVLFLRVSSTARLSPRTSVFTIERVSITVPILLVDLNVCIHILLAAITARAFSFVARILIRRSFLLYFMHRLFLASIARPLLTLYSAPALRALPLLHTPPSSFLCLVLVLDLPFFYLSALFGFLLSSTFPLARSPRRRASPRPPSSPSLQEPDTRASPSFDTCRWSCGSSLCLVHFSFSHPSSCGRSLLPLRAPRPRSTAVRRRPYLVVGPTMRRLPGDPRRRARLHTRASTVRDGRAAAQAAFAALASSPTTKCKIMAGEATCAPARLTRR